MSLPKFGPGDKIFAKVRGYPPWPARIEGIADETPNKMKFHVYFFGTGETAICKQEELFSYMDNREKYGKPMKKKGFNEALEQIDSELGISPLYQLPQTPHEQDSESEGNLVIDETPGKKSKPRPSLSTPTTTKINEGKLTKTIPNENEPPAKKPRKKSILPSDVETPGSSSKVISVDPPVSRSGRKIKQKRFSDVFDSESDNIDQDTPKSKQLTKSTGARLKSSGSKDLELDAEIIQNGNLVAFTPKGEEIRLKISLNRPAMFKSDKARLEWEANLVKDCKSLKARIESGDLLPEDVKKEIQEKYQDKLFQLEQKMGSEDKNEKLGYLKTEAELLDLDVKIKSSLSLKHAEPELCLKHLDDLLILKLSPLMVKKHPEIVDTIKKLRKYVGNLSSWEFSQEQSHIFASKAAAVRNKAEHVYNKIKSLFMVPYGKSFYEVFSKELADFNQITKAMKIDDVFSLTKDPTETDEGKEAIENSDV